MSQSNDSIQKGSWHMLTVVYNTGSIKFFVDGTLIVTKTNTVQSFRKSTYPLYIGIRYLNIFTGGYKGLLDELRIYNRALTDQEIKTIYNN